MNIDESYFWSDEMEGLVLASSLPPPPHLDGLIEEGGLMEGETLPESVLQALRSLLGF